MSAHDARVIVAIAVAAGLAAALLTGVVRRIALARGELDIPNERSSHAVPTPHGGGAAIVLSISVACVALWMRHAIDGDLLAALMGGLAVAALGFVDDRRHLQAAPRFAVHVLAALWALAWLGGLPPVRLGDEVLSSGAAGYVIGLIGMVWVLNLFNFMDGIDGLAASEGAFVAWGGALVAAFGPGADGLWQPALVVGAACCGFLLWNWPPARIFMGDVGSGYLGYAVAVLTVAATRTDPVALCVWLILGGVFWCDATVTLTRRVLRGESAHAAHRSHAYQQLARRWGQHRRVTLLALAINILWLLPWAAYAELHPSRALACTLAALIPLILLALFAGAGGRERAGSRA
jgi:Fuc2NAc and GlcNAc transferase